MDLRLGVMAVLSWLGLIPVLGVMPAHQTGLPPSGQEAPIFSAESELVVLQIMVEDRHGRYVTNLSGDAFSIREDGIPQSIVFFNRQDAPVTVGLLIDSSGSMLSVRDLVAAAAETFVTSSNPEDEAFALTFGDDVRSFLESHDLNFIVEQNRDAQLRSLLTLETSVPIEKLESVRYYGGFPMSADHVIAGVKGKLEKAA